MDAYIDAIKSGDLVKAKKAFGSIMAERTTGLIEERRKFIASSVMIEGEEPEDDEEDEGDDKEKPSKKKDGDEGKKDPEDEEDDEEDED